MRLDISIHVTCRYISINIYNVRIHTNRESCEIFYIYHVMRATIKRIKHPTTNPIKQKPRSFQQTSIKRNADVGLEEVEEEIISLS